MTTGTSIPDDVRRFILTCIPSVPYLEAVLLLRNTDTPAWNGKTLAQQLYISEKAAEALLVELNAAGLLQTAQPDSVACRYNPATNELRLMIDQLADIYPRHLVEVTNLIHSRTGKKAQQFADAFKWRKDS